MARQSTAQVLNQLVGKRIVFQGKFDYSQEERLKKLAKAHQGTIAKALDGKVTYLVLPDLSAGKTVRQKVVALNAKGASIQVMDADAFEKMLHPTPEQTVALIRGGPEGREVVEAVYDMSFHLRLLRSTPAMLTVTAESFDGADLNVARLDAIDFVQCSFVGAKMADASIGLAMQCDFSRVKARGAHFGRVEGSRFVGAELRGADFNESIADTDFSGADLEHAHFSSYCFGGRVKTTVLPNVIMTKAVLTKARFTSLTLKTPDFAEADLTEVAMSDCSLESARFGSAKLERAVMIDCKLVGADFTNADLRGANLSGADLTGACLAGADLMGCNLVGATLSGVDMSKAKNAEASIQTGGSVGPALKELGSVAAKAKRIELSFSVRPEKDGKADVVHIDTSGLKYGYGVRLPGSIVGAGSPSRCSAIKMADAITQVASMLATWKVHFETVEVSSTKSPKGGKELCDLVINAISEAFAQPVPPAEELAAATKVYREQTRQDTAANRKEREKAREQAEKQKQAATKQIEKKVAKAVGKVTDIGSFLKALEVRCDKPKIDKATSMLKASGFQLYNDVSDEHLLGVVKSQTDPDLVYACRIDHEGHYACCTQNLNICGGLRGSICKHLLVLIIGLVKAGELDPATIDQWIAKTHSAKPELDKEKMGDIFIRYKGAEAGEVDWRPTETLPEDYYAL